MVGTMECSREASGAQILPPIITSKITTKKRFAFKYGRIEVRARMPLGDWLIPGKLTVAYRQGHRTNDKRVFKGTLKPRFLAVIENFNQTSKK